MKEGCGENPLECFEVERRRVVRIGGSGPSGRRYRDTLDKQESRMLIVLSRPGNWGDGIFLLHMCVWTRQGYLFHGLVGLAFHGLQ